jgi:hypothetical protein
LPLKFNPAHALDTHRRLTPSHNQASVAVPAMQSMRNDQQLRSSVQSVADAFSLARAQAIRTGGNVIVIFQAATGSAMPGGLASTNIIDIVNDGPAAAADCSIAATEVL